MNLKQRINRFIEAFPEREEDGHDFLEKLAVIDQEFEGETCEELLMLLAETVDRHEAIVIAEQDALRAAVQLDEHAKRIGVSIQKLALAVLIPETSTKH